jgi:hypothetical protein
MANTVAKITHTVFFHGAIICQDYFRSTLSDFRTLSSNQDQNEEKNENGERKFTE